MTLRGKRAPRVAVPNTWCSYFEGVPELVERVHIVKRGYRHYVPRWAKELLETACAVGQSQLKGVVTFEAACRRAMAAPDPEDAARVELSAMLLTRDSERRAELTRDELGRFAGGGP